MTISIDLYAMHHRTTLDLDQDLSVTKRFPPPNKSINTDTKTDTKRIKKDSNG